MSDVQGSKNAGDENADHLDAVPEAGTPGADDSLPSVDLGAVSASDAPLDEAPIAFLAEDPDSVTEVDYEALAAELDRLEAETAAAAPVAPSQPEPAASEPALSASVADPAPAQEPVTRAPEVREAAPTVVLPPAAPPLAPPAPISEEAAPSPIFVQAPEPPKKRGNRGAIGLIGLVAALAYASLYAGALYAWQLFVNVVPALNMTAVLEPMDFVKDILLTGPYWVSVVVFWLAFWLLGVFVNRARWWSWVVLGLFVALATYAGFLGGVFFEAPFWKITGSQGIDLLTSTAFAPVGLFSFIIAREVTIWFGGWASRRGAKMSAHNREAREEYERIMAEGPAASA